MSRHARPSAVSRAVCSLTAAGRPGLSASLAAALVVSAAPAALLLGAGPAAAQTAPSPTPTASSTAAEGTASPSPSPAASTATASPTATPTATTSPQPTGSPTATPTGTPTPAPTSGPTAPVLRLSTSTAVVRPGQVVTLGARMYRGQNAPASGVLLDVVGRQPGGAFARVAQVRTGSDGLGVVRLAPRTTTEYQVRSPADARSTAAVTEVRRVEAQPVLAASLSRRVVRAGESSVLSGTLAPAYLGAIVRIDRNVGGRWQRVTAVRTGSGGTYRWTVAPGATGRYSFRAVLPGTTQHRTATSQVQHLVVDSRTLQTGDAGPEVSLLQQRLAGFGVDVGSIDGRFGSDLRHAVTAFQKSQGLARTGRYDEATRARLASPRAIQLRHPRAGRSVEVDLAKQVMYLAEGGRVKRIIDISSGNDQLYTVDGVTERAITPTGRFTIQRKIDGVRVSRLGELYRPAYFLRGWAIHGSPKVPPYPDSHGCVRVTNSQMNRIYSLLTVGTPVAVYR